MKTSNRKSSQFVQSLEPFQANNLFAEKSGNMYVVYSYGHHWPLWINKAGIWYENTSKYSRTTSKHKNQSNPCVDTVKLDVAAMKAMI